jgi:hypothetical protein
MATTKAITGGREGAILARLIRPEDDDLPAEAARALLNIRFGRHDLDRIHELVTKNQEDALTPAEKADLESYLHVSSILDLMHAKARRSLKKRP